MIKKEEDLSTLFENVTNMKEINSKNKWTIPIWNWSLTISHLNIHLKERLQGRRII